MVLVAYAGPVRPAAALRASVLCLPTDIHSLFVNKPSSSSSSSSSSSFTASALNKLPPAGGAVRRRPNQAKALKEQPLVTRRPFSRGSIVETSGLLIQDAFGAELPTAPSPNNYEMHEKLGND